MLNSVTMQRSYMAVYEAGIRDLPGVWIKIGDFGDNRRECRYRSTVLVVIERGGHGPLRVVGFWSYFSAAHQFFGCLRSEPDRTGQCATFVPILRALLQISVTKTT